MPNPSWLRPSAQRLRALRLSSFREYIDRIEKDADELEEFCNALTTNLTSFFRENHHFEYLAGTVLPLLQRRHFILRERFLPRRMAEQPPGGHARQSGDQRENDAHENAQPLPLPRLPRALGRSARGNAG